MSIIDRLRWMFFGRTRKVKAHSYWVDRAYSCGRVVEKL